MFEFWQKSRGLIAFAAGFLFLLQAWAAGAMPPGPQLDSFGNPFCITSVDHDGTSPAVDHSKLSDCCTLGCGMASFSTISSDGGIVLSRVLLRTVVFSRIQLVIRAEAPEHDPGSPRAPPRMA